MKTTEHPKGFETTAKERAELVVSWMKKQEKENFFLGTLEMNLIAEFESAEREAYAAILELEKRIAELERERDQLRAELDLYKRNLSLDAIRAIAETNSGKELHRSWRDTMLLQGRHVSAERMGWDLLPERDKQLDVQIAQDVLSDFAAYLHAQADLATAMGQNEQMLKAVGVENFPAFLARIAELERERDALVKEASEYLAAVRNCETLLAAADKRAAQAEASAVRWEKRANQAAGRDALQALRDAWKEYKNQ